MLLMTHLTDYLLRMDVSAEYADQLRWAIRAWEKQLAREALLTDLTHEAINAHLLHLREQGYASETRRSRRRMLLTLAADAARLGLIPPVNRDMVARIKSPPSQPDGLSWEQAKHVIRLLTDPESPHDKWLSFRYRRTGIERRWFWVAYFSASWDSGAPADVRRLSFSDIQEGGRVYRLRSKSGKPLRWQFSDFTLHAIDKISQPERVLVFPLSGGLNLFRRESRKILVEIAGLTDKTLGGFRAGAGTDAELLHGDGAGCQLLGNTPQVFVKHYEIARIAQKPAVAPRPLEGLCQEKSSATCETQTPIST